ncbi:MAG: radical SAM protein [Candidatus Omnitrophica bacterium]|nr:radical SAM protein [Candidatus Omnitrophota bacterium]MCG2708265.1 radical SAM protein [Candidatus Omnitrophota bacterium]
MSKIKIILKKYPNIYKIAKAIRYLLISSLIKIDGSKKKYPRVVQLPITYRCNSRCKMCYIWQKDWSTDMNALEFSHIIKDPIFKKVVAIGINGGEPALISNLTDYAREVLKLPKIKSLNIISNGFIKKPFLKSIEEIYKNCREKNVSFHIAISLDGVGKIHDTVRGRPNVFEKVVSTIDEIMANRHKYCDSIDVGCTIIRQNIDYLIELEAFAKSKNYTMTYRLGVDNKRIESDRLRDSYSVIYSQSLRQGAKEFMHRKFFEATDLYDKFKYFSIFYWLNSDKPKRLLGCAWKDEGITMDARGDLYYCAVASDKIGGLRESRGAEIFFSKKNIEHRKSIIKNYCDRCIHDYSGKPEFENLIVFFRELWMDKFSMKIYKYKCMYGLI